MKLGITILKQEELLDELIQKYRAENLCNITTISSSSIIDSSFSKSRRIDVVGTFRHLMNYGNDESVILLQLLKEEEVSSVIDILKNTVSKKQYLFFTVTVDQIEGTI